jgi:hypothetical protein
VASSACSAATWAAEAKQSNDFSGIPGNDLTLDISNSNLVTALCSAPCKSGGLCTTKTSNSGGSAEIAAGKGKLTGTLIESANSNDSPGSVPLVCSNYTSADANTYSFNGPPDRAKVVSITIRSSTFLDLGAQQICANLPYQFTTFSGALAAADVTFGFTGLLPDCSGRGAPPCHDRRHDSEATDPAGGFDIVLVADLPAAAGDPRMN